MTFQVPWVISDVAEVPLEVSRLLAYIATNAKEGILEPGDLQVRSLASPGSSIRVAPGSFAAINNFPGNSQQTYLGQNDAEVTASVTATGGSARSDMVYVRINDTGQTNGGTSGAASLVVAQGVSPTATTLADVNSSISGIALARIDMPANTSTVQQSYITDLRKLIQPRKQDLVRIANLPDNTNPQDLTASTFVNWPSEAAWTVDIPDWAVRAQVIAYVSSYKIVEGGTAGANIWGEIRCQLGTLYTPSIVYNHSVPAGLGLIDAASTQCAGDIYIPTSDRGTTGRSLRLEGKRTGSNDPGSLIRADWGTCVTIQVIFYESPDDQFWQN